VENSSFDDSKDGVFHIDFKTLERKLVISLQDLSQISKAAIQNQEQWVNHLMISPNGKKMMFLHRWLDNGVKKDALYVADIDGSALKCLSNEGMVSHCFWENNEQIIAYLRRQEKGDQYYRVHIESGSIKALPLPKTQVFGDGHPNVYKQWMLFDSYPDRSGMKKLWIFNLETNLLKELASFYEPLKYYAESRCDLHPRFSMDGKRVFFDSVHENKRRLYYMNMEENI
ncbi:MAG: glycosyl transferase, partial [Bacteroidales bacterium]|nr:glycosyl transferase [Bacteroidales bacterium]